MATHSFSNHRLLMGACMALAGLTLFLGMYAAARLQSRALEREMAAVKIFWPDGSAGQRAERPNGGQGENNPVMTLGL